VFKKIIILDKGYDMAYKLHQRISLDQSILKFKEQPPYLSGIGGFFFLVMV
jgi:hypothetical protein